MFLTLFPYFSQSVLLFLFLCGSRPFIDCLEDSFLLNYSLSNRVRVTDFLVTIERKTTFIFQR